MGHSQSKQRSYPTHQQPSSTNPLPPFTYKPLTSPRNFRILRLTWHLRDKPKRGWVDYTLHGSIVEASLDKVPDYFALSYTWGDAALTDKIFIDGQVLGITQNCSDALRRMLKGKSSIMIWVDSICINQAGDAQALQERGGQVALMDEIYSKAIQVNVHLGAGDERSEIAIDAVKRLTLVYLGAIMSKSSGLGKGTARGNYEEVADEVLAVSPEFPYGKLHGLFRLPWFRRTWVLQEVALAKKTMFYCGERVLHFDNLVAACDFTRLPYSKLDATASHWRSYLEWHHAFAEYIRRRQEGEDIQFKLMQLLAVTMALEATRPEDKIHGLYGCAKKLGLSLPDPDYTKSVAQVYTEAALACIEQDQNLDILEFVEGAAASQYGHPSWVPNFSHSLRKWTPETPPTWGLVNRKNKLISGDSRCQWSIIPEGNRIKVLGRRLDQVAAVGQPWKVDSRTTLLGDAEMNSGQVMHSFVECVATWFDIVLERNRRNGGGTYTAAENTAVQHLVVLLTKGRDLSVSPAELADYISVLVNVAKGNFDALQSHMLQSGNKIIAVNESSEISLNPATFSILEQAMTHSMWKLVFSTATRAYLGTGSYSCRPGDLIVVLHGMAVPCLIRPCDEGFKFVSAAYVDGIMNGEFWNAGSVADDEWFTLI